MKRIYFLILLLVSSRTYSQNATWSEDVAAIFYNKCTSCHHSGGIGPFSLIDYNDAVMEALSIQNAINDGYMPPWPPDPTYRHLAHERILSGMEIAAINDWVNNATPLGNIANAPIPPTYNSSATITNPDYIFQIPTYTVNTATDLYRNFVIPSGLINNLAITDFEVIPGNRAIVHHVIVWEDTSDVPSQLDLADPDPGFTNFGGSGSSKSNMIGFWVPGMSAFKWPTGMGQLLPAGTDIVIQVHYPGGTFNATDSTHIRLKTSSAALRNVYTLPVLNHDNTITNGPLFIPANTTPTFYSQFTIPFNLSFISVGAHMHLLGQSAVTFGVTLLNDTIPFLRINEWDFHWQGLYQFRNVLKIPAGTTLYGICNYDNTLNNPHNPNNPPQDVSVGEATTDEMMLFYFSFTQYVTGDENIVIDSSAIVTSVYDPAFADIIQTPQLYDPAPNPSGDFVNLSFYLPATDDVIFRIYDLKGAIVKTSDQHFDAGLNIHRISINDLASGEYILKMQAGGMERSKKVVVSE